MPSTRKTWIGGAIVVALLLLVATWFLLLSPVRDGSSTVRAEAEQVEMSNETLNTRVTKLRQQFAEIDTYRAELAALEERIPSTVDYQSIVDEIERSVDRSNVFLISISSAGGIVPVTPFTELKQDTTTASDTGESTTVESSASTSSAPQTVSGAEPTRTGALSTQIPGFYQIPLTITVQGDYAEILKFSQTLQEDSDRVLLVPSVAASALTEAPESDGAPKADVGDINYVLNVFAYVLEYDQSGIQADEEVPEEIQGTLPVAPKDNIFAPSR